jgi:DNA-binding HxlR family transcriptional regulator
MDEPVKNCPVEEAIRIIGGKWKLLLLRSLLLNGPQRYNDLLKSVTKISPKELTRNLRELMNAGLLERTSVSAPLPQYKLTELGMELMPTFETLLVWGKKLMVSG